jgi:hypothetical protein
MGDKWFAARTPEAVARPIREFCSALLAFVLGTAFP